MIVEVNFEVLKELRDIDPFLYWDHMTECFYCDEQTPIGEHNPRHATKCLWVELDHAVKELEKFHESP